MVKEPAQVALAGRRGPCNRGSISAWPVILTFGFGYPPAAIAPLDTIECNVKCSRYTATNVALYRMYPLYNAQKSPFAGFGQADGGF